MYQNNFDEEREFSNLSDLKYDDFYYSLMSYDTTSCMHLHIIYPKVA